jgi:hypothetical protein
MGGRVKKKGDRFTMKKFLFIAVSLCAVRAPLSAQWVDGVAPPPHAAGVDRSTGITPRFNVDIQPFSLIDTTILVYGELSGRHLSSSITYAGPARTVVVHPLDNFFSGESVEVTLTTGIEDTGGHFMPAAFTWGVQGRGRYRALYHHFDDRCGSWSMECDHRGLGS